MPFITQGKTNIKYILIVVILAVIVGGGILAYQYWWAAKKETTPPETKLPVGDIYKCEKDDDCISVRDGCCYCSAGGRATAINKNYSDYWDNKLVKECEGQGCYQFISGDWTCSAKPKCIWNQCKLEAVETVDWKTYKNEKYLFEIKYPGNWRVRETLFNEEKLDLSIEPINEIKDDPLAWKSEMLNIVVTKPWFGLPEEGLSKDKSKKYEETTFVGIEAIKTTQLAPMDFGGCNIYINFNYAKHGWYIELDAIETKINDHTYECSGPDPIHDQILTTFKFIEADETADWKNYQSSVMGFAIKHPSDWMILKEEP
jgi:hypothetical protein